jgi:hypothetical protein
MQGTHEAPPFRVQKDFRVLLECYLRVNFIMD